MATPTPSVPPPTIDPPQYEETSFSTTPSTQHPVNEGHEGHNETDSQSQLEMFHHVASEHSTSL